MIIVHVITVRSIMLCYPIIINVSNIKENTPTYILTNTCTHMYTRSCRSLSQPKQDRCFVFQPALGYHQLVGYNMYNHNRDIKANADFHLLQGFLHM